MNTMNRIFCRTLILAAALFCAGELAAQGMPSIFGKTRKNNSNRSSEVPTTVTAMTMDIDMGRNLVTLLGDVFVDDQDMTIRCNKMLIYLEEKSDEQKGGTPGGEKDAAKPAPDKGKTDAAKPAPDKEKTDAAKPAPDKEKEAKKAANDDDSPAGRKQPTRIECYGDVIIQAKNKSGAKEQKEQKATAGKAVYDLKKDEITLTEKPVLHDGSSKVDGTKIIIIVNEERMIVIRGTASTLEGIGGLGGK